MKDRTKGTIEDYMKHFNIPLEYKFIGFSVHHEERDEFLASYENDKYLCRKAWSRTPEISERYSTQPEAERIAKEIDDGSIVVLLFDTGKTIVVGNTG